MNKKYGTWALVVGSAEGLGEAYSTELAKRKMNLLMVDNQQEKMLALAGKLEKEFSIQTKCLTIDLSENDAVEKIMNLVEKVDCRLLLNVAAFSRVKPFFSNTQEELERYANINCLKLTSLVHSFGSKLKKEGGGGILMMSSLAGLIGMQMITPYAATKAYTWNLAEALHYELKPFNIDVMACIAGATTTPAYLSSEPKYGFFKPKIMKPDEVAVVALNKLGKKALFIAGFSNRLNYFILTRLLPRSLAASTANKVMAKMYRDKIER
ncbi:MAG TPA: SDR family NAD(P)-dependent oxidoreductase [Bacteroidales bacterium]